MLLAGSGCVSLDGMAAQLKARADGEASRARIEGEIPHIQVWINDTQVVNWTDSANHAIGGAVDGMIALQMHLSNEKTPRWRTGGFHRFRNIAIREF